MISIAQKRKPSSSKRKKPMGLRSIVFSMMLAGAVVPLAVFSSVNYSQTRDAIMQSVNKSLSDENSTNANTVEAWIKANEDIVRVAAQAPELKMEPSFMKPYLLAVNKELPGFYAVVAIDSSGQQVVRSTDEALNNVKDRAYFQKVMAGAPSAFQTGISKATNKTSFFVAAPVQDGENKPIGAVAAYAHMTTVTDKITGGKIGNTGFSFLVDNTGTILAHPDEKKVGTKIDDAFKNFMTAENYGRIVDLSLPGDKDVKMVSNSAGKDLVLLTQIDSDEVDAPLHEAKVSALKFLGGSALIAALLSFLFASGLSNRISRLAALTSAVSRARRVEDIDTIEEHIDAVGGAREIKGMATAIKRLTASIKLAMRMS